MGIPSPCKAFALLDVCLAVNQAEGEGEMTEEEQQAHLSLFVASIEMQMSAVSTPYPYDGHHDASTPYPHVPYYSDKELEQHPSTYNHMMGYDDSKLICP